MYFLGVILAGLFLTISGYICGKGTTLVEGAQAHLDAICIQGVHDGGPFANPYRAAAGYHG